MPEGYTHVRTALRSIGDNRIKNIKLEAYGLGANGPDFLFAYKAYSKKENKPINDLGHKIHKENTGKFLVSLISNADTNIQKSYSLGFLSHYATDQIIHPFVKYITDNGPYDMNRGHSIFEIGLDSELYLIDYGTRCIPVNASTPVIRRDYLKEICDLLKNTIYETYDIKIPIKLLKVSFNNFYMLRRLFISKYGIKRMLFLIAEKILFHEENYILGHVVPAKPLKALPRVWVNPYTGKKSNDTIFNLLKHSEDLGRVFIGAAEQYWKDNITKEKLAKKIGNKSYSTGLDVS